MDSKKVIILDIRVPTLPLAELSGHSAPVNGMTWAPHSNHNLVTVADDAQALIWDYNGNNNINNNANNNNLNNNLFEEPLLAYSAENEINSVSWSKANPENISITFEDKLQMLHL